MQILDINIKVAVLLKPVIYNSLLLIIREGK